MLISVSFVSSTSGAIEKQFNADFDKYFSVNKELSKAAEFVKRGIVWEGSESFGSFLRIEAA